MCRRRIRSIASISQEGPCRGCRRSSAVSRIERRSRPGSRVSGAAARRQRSRGQEVMLRITSPQIARPVGLRDQKITSSGGDRPGCVDDAEAGHLVALAQDPARPRAAGAAQQRRVALRRPDAQVAALTGSPSLHRIDVVRRGRRAGCRRASQIVLAPTPGGRGGRGSAPVGERSRPARLLADPAWRPSVRPASISTSSGQVRR